MCNCKSYNGDISSEVGINKTENVILKLPDNVDTGRQNRKVSIDYCISDVIQHLWNNNINTLGCCCGHNKSNPSVVIEMYVNVDKVFDLIKEVDERHWVVSRWERVDYNMK